MRCFWETEQFSVNSTTPSPLRGRRKTRKPAINRDGGMQQCEKKAESRKELEGLFCPLISDSSIVQVSVFGLVESHSPSLALPPSRAHMHIQLLSLDQSICHPQGQRSSILGRKHYRACSAYPPPPHPPPEFFFLRAQKKKTEFFSSSAFASAISKELKKSLNASQTHKLMLMCPKKVLF